MSSTSLPGRPSLFDRYQPRHARRNHPVRTLVLVTGLTTTLGLPALAAPAAASTVPSATVPSAAVTAGASPTLKTGSRGAAVVDLQRRLRIPADGAFGPQTRGAVLGFQRSRGLVADGVVGRRTWAALRGGAPALASARAAAPAPVPAPPAPPAAAPRASRDGDRSASLGAAAVQEASRYAGRPYRYGAAGPDAFDCSGFTSHVFRQLGVSIPRTSAAQYDAARKISKADLQVGDLIFMKYSGRIGHVGIYAGNNTMWDAGRSGGSVRHRTIWTQDFLVGRVG